MAMIKCKECGHDLSDKASVCPNCGCPIEKCTNHVGILTKNKTKVKLWFALLLFLLIGNGNYAHASIINELKSRCEQSYQSVSVEEQVRPIFLLTKNGIGEIKLGMKTSSVPNSIDGLYNKKEIEEDDFGEPILVLYNGEKKIITLGIEDDMVTSITVFTSSNVATANGLHVGTSIHELIEKHGFVISYADYGEGDFEKGLYAENKTNNYLSVTIMGNISDAAMELVEKSRDSNGEVVMDVPTSEILNGKVTSITIVKREEPLVVQRETNSSSNVASFRQLGDVFEFIKPSKSFETRDGDIEIKCIENGNVMKLIMYYKGKILSEVGWDNPNTVAQGDYVRLGIISGMYKVTFVLHLPDSRHKNAYMYFEPLPTTTNRNLSSALSRANIDVPITDGWMVFEPMVDGNRASLSFQPRGSKPVPISYNMK